MATLTQRGSAGGMVVIQATPPVNRNPYYTLLAPHLNELGDEVIFSTDFDELTKLAWSSDTSKESRPVIVHLHQLEPLYRPRVEEGNRAAARRFVDWVVKLRMLGASIVYTMHNRQPHDRRLLGLDREVHTLISPVVSRVVVHGDAAVEAAERWFPSEKIAVVRHPNFVDVYGPECPREYARRDLQVGTDEFVVLALGELKPYKGLELVLDGFERASIPAARLLIVGRNGDEEYVRMLEDRVAEVGFGKVRLVVRTLPEDDIATWLGVADVAVFGFEEILMSGSVMLALSYGLPVVVPSIGCIPEYVSDGLNGFLYEVGDANSLARALHRAKRSAIERSAVKSSVEQYHPREIALRMQEVYVESLDA